jgi:hypothetical protein
MCDCTDTLSSDVDVREWHKVVHGRYCIVACDVSKDATYVHCLVQPSLFSHKDYSHSVWIQGGDGCFNFTCTCHKNDEGRMCRHILYTIVFTQSEMTFHTPSSTNVDSSSDKFVEFTRCLLLAYNRQLRVPDGGKPWSAPRFILRLVHTE